MSVRRKVHVLRLSWPVEAETLAELLKGKSARLDADPWLARLLAILRSDNALGDFGAYEAVAELTPCWELFTPGHTARPTVGQPGVAQVSTNVMVTLHLPAEVVGADLDRLLDDLVAAHPWEIPVIEISGADLVLRKDHANR